MPSGGVGVVEWQNFVVLLLDENNTLIDTKPGAQVIGRYGLADVYRPAHWQQVQVDHFTITRAFVSGNWPTTPTPSTHIRIALQDWQCRQSCVSTRHKWQIWHCGMSAVQSTYRGIGAWLKSFFVREKRH